MTRFGIIIPQDGKSVIEQPPKFSSEIVHLSVDLEANPAHMQIIDRSGGSAFTDPNDPMQGNHTQQETLITVAHKLGFTPYVLPYFYVLASTVSGDTRIDSYSHGILILSGSAGTLSDNITYEVDQNELRIIHRLDTYGFNTTYASPAPQLTIRTKFYITPIDIGVSLYRAMGPPY